MPPLAPTTWPCRSLAFLKAIGHTLGTILLSNKKYKQTNRLKYHNRYLAKVGVVGSNPIARSKFLAEISQNLKRRYRCPRTN